MRKIDEAFQAHLEKTCTTLAHCWIVKRKDGVQLGFTDHDETLTIEAVECRAETGLQPSQAATQLGFGSDNVDVSGALSDTSLKENEIESGLYDDAVIEVWLVNWSAPIQRVLLRTMIVGEITREDSIFKAELRGFTSLLDKQNGRSYIRTCDAQVGDARCGINISSNPYRAQGSVTSIVENGSFLTDAMEGFEIGWFSGGTLVWSNGNNAGSTQKISQNSHLIGGEIRLWQLPPNKIEPGDSFEIFAGCDKRFETCKAKFANSVNFRGFPHIPGNDFAMNYAANGNNHDGSALIK